MAFDAALAAAFLAQAAAAAFSALCYLGYRQARRELHGIERHGISAEGGAVPTMVMEADAPVEVILAKERRLYISTMTMSEAERWRGELVRFLARNIGALDMMPMLDGAEPRLLAAARFARALEGSGMKKAVARFLGRTMLRDRRRNPSNVTARWLWKNCSELQLAEILLIAYAYNNGAYIKKNYLSLMGKLGAVCLGMSGMPSPSSRGTGSGAPLCPESPYAPAHGQKKPPMKSASWRGAEND